MIIVELKGGLGNQMFQYAAARGHAKKNEPIYLDHSFLEKNFEDQEHFTARHYELHIFKNLNIRSVKKWQIALFKDDTFVYKLARLFLRRYMKNIREENNEFIPFDSFPPPNILYLEGYFQSEKYWGINGEAISKAFQFPELDPDNEATGKKIQHAVNSVSLHIRRGDYATSTMNAAIHGVLPLAYYYEALDVLRSKCPTCALFVFSDDAEWVRENLKLNKLSVCYIENNKGEHSWKDMALMGHCKHHIIANSSFSWWGAWLNPKPGKIIIAPKKWFNDPILNLQADSIIPDTWITI